MAATTRNKSKNSNKEVFPPSDRELALRGKIKTGWSTVALHQNLKNLGLSPLEMTKIEKVLERAEAVEKVNQLRIGVELMKHQQNKEKHLGDGQRTCLICGIDFSSHQRGRKPVSVHFCDHCGSAVCSSCMLADKRLSGTTMTLCPLCYEEKEIWKRSGAWFNNALPVIDISQSELEKFEEQQKLLQSRTFTLGKHTDETTAREFVNPYQLEAESSDEDEELNSLQLHKTPSPTEPPAAAAASTAFPPPISFVDKPHLQQALQRPSAYKPTASSTFPRSISPSQAMQEFRGRSDTESEEPIGQKLQPLGDDEEGRQQRLLRRGAVSTKDKDRYESSRRKAVGFFGSNGGSSHGSVSPLSGGSPSHRAQNDPTSSTGFLPTSQSSEITEQLRKQLANPPPRRPPPQLAGEVPQKLSDQSTVEVIVEPPTPKPLKSAAAVRRRKKEREDKVKPLEDEFRKVAMGPSSSSQQPLPPPSKKPPVLSSPSDEFKKVSVAAEATTTAASASKPPPPSKPAPIPESDEFHKVTHKVGGVGEGTAAGASSKPPPPSKPAPIPESDEFHKITPKAKPPPRVTALEHDEFRKVDTSSSKELPLKKLPAPPPPADEFRKVYPKPADVKKSSPPPPPTEEFRKVHPKPVEIKSSPPLPPANEFRKVHPKPVEVKKSSTPPRIEGDSAKPVDVKKPVPLPRTELDEFRKVGMVAVAASTSPAGKRQTPPPSIPDRPVELDRQESPRRVPEVTPRSKLPRNDEDNKSIVSTSSLASQSSRSSVPPSGSSRGQSPASDHQDVQPRRGLPARQGEIDDDQPLSRFRTRSGAMRPDAQRHSGSPVAATSLQQPQQESRETKSSLSDDIIEDFDGDFQPRVRSRSGAVDSRILPRGRSPASSSKGGTEPKLPGDSKRVRLDRRSSQEESGGSSEDMSQPRMRTRSRAYHGRPPMGSRGKQEEPSSTEDAPSPRMRTRSRAFHGDSQRPKKFTRTPSPRSNEAQSVTDPLSSLEIPQTRPRSSSTGHGLQRDLSSGRTSPTPKPDGAFGSVELEMEYVESENLLKVTIARCKGLRSMDGNGLSDPYVKLFLLPGNRIHKFQTKTIYKNLDPVFDETFMFYSVSMEAMKTKQLRFDDPIPDYLSLCVYLSRHCHGMVSSCLIVMDYDEFSPDDFIGGTRVKLYDVLYSQTYKINIRRLLDDNIVAQTVLEDKTRGRVRLSFSYSMDREVFSIYVHKADHLVPESTKGQCDPYVKCYFESSGTSSCTKKKTTVCRKTLSPVFNQVLEFSEKLIHLSFARMTVSVWDRSKLPSSEIGNVQFKDAVFWKKFLAQPNLTVTEWYVLYAPDHDRTRTGGISPKHKMLTLPRKYT